MNTTSNPISTKVRDVLIESGVTKTDTLIVGCSGGRDSMCLLHIIIKEGFSPILAHVNYQLRTESDTEERYLRDFAVANNILFEGLITPLTEKTPNLESKARKIRYDFFEELRKKHGAKAILTGHHLNDSLETALLNFTRSTGIKGLRGINQKRTHIIRPLISISRSEIDTYIKKNAITYFEDKSNTSPRFKRNIVRHRVIPALTEINPEVVDSFKHTQSHLSELEDFLEESVSNWISTYIKDNSFNVAEFQRAHPIIQKEVLKKLFHAEYKHTEMLRQQHLEQLVSLLQEGRNGTQKEFGSTKKLSIAGDKAKIA